MIDNDLRIYVYDGTTLVADPLDDLDLCEGLTFNTQNPGGIFGDCSFFIQKPVTDPIQWRGGHRVVIINGQSVVYEGYIQAITRTVRDGIQGFEFTCQGGTDKILANNLLEKRWCDNRIEEDVWIWETSVSGAEKCTFDSYARMRFTPKAVAWTTDQFASRKYVSPTGQTIKRITFDYTLAEGAQQWEIGLYNWTSAAGEWSATASGGPTSVDLTLATPSNTINLFFASKANQTPAADGTIYGQFSNVKVYSELDATITAKVIADDLVGVMNAAGYLNSSVAEIDTAGTPLTLEPFITQGYPKIADILNDAVGRGDGAYNRWAWGLLESDRGNPPNGLPVLFVEQYPSTTDYEYLVNFGDANIAGPVDLVQDFIGIINYIVLSYTDPNGNFFYLTPDDDANLKDSTSITKWGIYAIRLDCGTTTSTEATAYARRIVATYKDPPYKLLSGLQLDTYIQDKDGNDVPVCRVRSGERVKMTNFLGLLSGVDPTFVISSTGYGDDSETLSITTGVPGAPLGSRQVARIVSAPPDDATGGGVGVGGGGGGGGADRLNFYKTSIWKKALKLGLATAGQKGKLTAKQKKALKKAVRKKSG